MTEIYTYVEVTHANNFMVEKKEEKIIIDKNGRELFCVPYSKQAVEPMKTLCSLLNFKAGVEFAKCKHDNYIRDEL